MKFGMFDQLPCADWQSPFQRYQDILEQIQLADELGFAHAWFAEHHFEADFCISPSPLMIAASAAQRTKRIRLGVAVNLLPYHNPIRMAEDIATLDILSNGRAEFGVSRGSPTHSKGFNIPHEESRERFLEALEFILEAWTQEKFSFKGKYYNAQDIRITPKPLQKPHPSVRIAANSADTFELVGKLGHALFAASVVVPLPILKESVKRYRQALVEGGHPIGADEVYLLMPLYVAKDAKEARAVPQASVKNFITIGTQSVAGIPGAQESAQRLLNMTYDDYCNDIAIFEEPGRCIERLKSLEEEFHPGEMMFWFNQGGLIDHSKVMKAMTLFAEEVMPHFI
jgi:alkanesulfonate monooxygenase SsuD/methylene tetrahydromethanopterin reductase-like flavin-dependent oxidoreductase (luciferase family)